MSRDVSHRVHSRRATPELAVALDWTEFDRDGQSTIAANLITSHGRATPLVWKSEKKAKITDGERNDLEDEVLLKLQEVVPADVKVTVVADRGFGDTKLYDSLMEAGWDFVIRFRGAIHVENAQGEMKPAKGWLQPSGRARMMKGVPMTKRRCEVPAFVSVLFRQGAYGYSAIPAMPDERLQMLMTAFAEVIEEHAVFRETFGLI